jgi:hypothetical protein
MGSQSQSFPDETGEVVFVSSTPEPEPDETTVPTTGPGPLITSYSSIRQHE